MKIANMPKIVSPIAYGIWIVFPSRFLYVNQGSQGTIWINLPSICYITYYQYIQSTDSGLLTSLDPMSSIVMVKVALKRPTDPIAVTILNAKYDQYVGMNDPTKDAVDDTIIHPNNPNFLP